jgi:extracellular elastinolytic metalloproteinase
MAQEAPDLERHYDARLQQNAARALAQPRLQAQTQALSADVQELSSLDLDETTGAVRSLSSERGFLSAAAPGKPMDIAMDFVRRNLAALNLQESDLAGYKVSNVVFSKVTGATRIYLQQQYKGIPVYNAQLQINVNRDGRIISVNNSFMSGLQGAVASTKPAKALPAAVGEALKFSGIKATAPGMVGANRVANAGISLEPIDGSLMLLPIRPGEARLVWNFQIHSLD